MARGTPARTGSPDAERYDAFISYSQAVSGKLAASLQRWLERFATPWYRPRSLRIFRDYTNLPANDDLWMTIERSLDASAHFILLASPEAAKSRWVDREVQWWRDHRQAEDFYIVLTGGELRWSEESDRWDPDHTTSLPSAAREMFASEPLWVDLSSVRTTEVLDRSNPVLLNSVAQIAAPLRGVSKDSLVGEHITYYRRARRQRRGALAALAILTVLAIVAAVAARIQADIATTQARIATSRALASAAIQDVGVNLRLAQLLAVEAYRLHPDAESRSALFQAVTASPGLVRYLNAKSTVTAITGSRDGRYLAVGTQSGQVIRWRTDDFRALAVTDLRQTVTSVALSRDGSTLSASAGQTAIVWTPGAGVRRLQVPGGMSAALTATSPSGRYVVVYGQLRSSRPQFYSVPGTLILLDTQTNQITRTAVRQPWTAITVPTDRQAVLLSSALGYWERRDLPTMRRASRGQVGFGLHVYASAVSPDGSLITRSNGGDGIPLWPTRAGVRSPHLRAASSGPTPVALAISPDDRTAVTASNGSLYVASIGRASSRTASPVELGGSEEINPGDLTFVGDSRHLASASGRFVAFWNLAQLSRIGRQVLTHVPLSCVQCSGPFLSVSPDGAAAVMSFDGSVTVQQTRKPFKEVDLTGSRAEVYYGASAWMANSQEFWLATSRGLEANRLTHGLVIRTMLPGVKLRGPIKALSTFDHGHDIVVVTSTNLIEVYSAASGKLIRKIRGPREPSAGLLGSPNANIAAVQADGANVAIITPTRGVDLIDVNSARQSALRVTDAYAVAFGGSNLAILQVTGRVRVRNLNRRTMTTLTGRDVTAFAITRRGSMVAEYRLNDSVLLQEANTGRTIGEFGVASPFAGQPTSLAFTPDGTRLFVAVEGTGGRFAGKLEQWDLSARDWITTACTTAGTAMTPGQWREAVGTEPPPTLACQGNQAA